MGRVLPILFNTDMVKVILDGKKTVTRRAMKPQPLFYTGRKYIFDDNECPPKWQCCDNIIETYKYQPGDILYVRETWKVHRKYNSGLLGFDVEYMAGTKITPCIFQNIDRYLDIFQKYGEKKGWNTPYSMPKEATRIWLKVTDVRIERLHEITEGQAKKEGIETYTKDEKLYKYAVNINWWEEYHGKHRNNFTGNWWQDMPKTAKEAYSYFWDSTVKKSDLAKYGWEADPWVWVIEFERCEKPGEG